jgi:hypothetical protein
MHDARGIKKDFLNIGRIFGQFRRRPNAQRLNILRMAGLGPGHLPRAPRRRPDRGFVVGRGGGRGGRGFRKQWTEESNMNEHTLNRLQAEVDDLIAKIDQEVGKANNNNGEDDDFEDGDSNPSMDASDSDGNGDNNDDDEEEDDDVAKFSNTYHLNTRSVADRPGALEHSDHRSPGLGNSPAVQPAGRHKFDALTDKIMREENTSKTEAQSRTRQRFPDVYRSYQDHLAGSSTQQQSFARSRVRGSYTKSAPTTFEDLVNAEMRKGCNYEIAAQRVLQLHGANALRNRAINKRAQGTSGLAIPTWIAPRH